MLTRQLRTDRQTDGQEYSNIPHQIDAEKDSRKDTQRMRNMVTILSSIYCFFAIKKTYLIFSKHSSYTLQRIIDSKPSFIAHLCEIGSYLTLISACFQIKVQSSIPFFCGDTTCFFLTAPECQNICCILIGSV